MPSPPHYARPQNTVMANRLLTVLVWFQTEVLVLSRDGFNRLCGNLHDVLKRNMETYETLEIPELPEEQHEAEEELILEPENMEMPVRLSRPRIF